jgi:hypothetical protein
MGHPGLLASTMAAAAADGDEDCALDEADEPPPHPFVHAD